MYSEATAGLFRANPEAASPNSPRFVDPTTPGTPAQDIVTDSDTGTEQVTISGIGYIGKAGGSAVIIPFFTTEYPTGKAIPTPVVARNNASVVKDAIRNVVEMHEVDPVVTVTWAADLLTIRHVGAGTIDYIIINDTVVQLARTAL